MDTEDIRTIEQKLDLIQASLPQLCKVYDHNAVAIIKNLLNVCNLLLDEVKDSKKFEVDKNDIRR